MKRFLLCKRVCPVVAELKRDVANRDCEIARLQKKVEALEKNNSYLRGRNKEHEKRLAKIRQFAFGYIDPDAPERG